MPQGGTCSVTSTLRRTILVDDFCGIARAVLGNTYSLSIVLIGDKKARSLNETHRHKHTAANVLSFPLDPHHGEIFLNVTRVEREAHRFNLSSEGHLRYLLIHGCLHLSGYTHGSTMEQAERHFLKKFSLR